MDELEQSDLENETNDTHKTFYQNAIHNEGKYNAFIKNYKCGLFSLVFVIKLGGHMTEIFSVALHKTDKALKA